MLAIVSLLPIFGYAIIFYLYFNKSSSVSIFFSISAIISTLFIFGMFDILKYGAYILFYGGIGLLLFFSLKFRSRVVRFTLSLPFIIFTVMSITYLYLIQDMQLLFWDEYAHWGLLAKETYFFHHFYDTTSVLPGGLHYPPGIIAWDYFITLITGFTEGKLYFATFLVLFSSTLMMYENFSFKDIHWIILVFALQMVIFAGFGHWFSSIYIDHVIGAMFAGIVLAFLVDKFTVKELLLFIFPLSSIVLFKEIGLYFGFASVGLMIVLTIVRSNFKKSIPSIFVLSLLFIIMFGILKGWGVRQESLGVPKHHQSMGTIVKNIVSDKKILDEKTETEVKKRFWDVVLYQQLHKERVSMNYNEFTYFIMSKYKSGIKLSTVGVILFFIALSFIIYFSVSSREKKLEVGVISSYMLVITLLYLVILYFSYLVAFGSDALRMPSFVRYMNISVLPLFFISFSLLLPLFYTKRYIEKENKSGIERFLLLFFLFIIFTVITKPYLKPLYTHNKNFFRADSHIDTITKDIVKYVPMKSKLFVLFSVKNRGNLNNVLRYALIPTKSQMSENEFHKKTFKEMVDRYSKYDYIWFYTINQEMIDKNRPIFRKKSKNTFFTLYKVENSSNSVSFKPIF